MVMKELNEKFSFFMGIIDFVRTQNFLGNMSLLEAEKCQFLENFAYVLNEWPHG